MRKPRMLAAGIVPLALLALTATESTAAPSVLQQQANAHRVAAELPAPLRTQLAGQWFDSSAGKLTVAVTDSATARAVTDYGARAVLVQRNNAQLHELLTTVHKGIGLPGVNSVGIDPVHNGVNLSVNRTLANAETQRFLSGIKKLPGVSVTESNSSPRQQSGTVQTGDPWYPGSESNCSVGFSATDSTGAKQFLTAGHCTNDVNQPVFGASGEQNKIGTSNVDGTHSIDAQEGDMGVVAVTEAGWDLSAEVNTYGSAAVTVSGSVDAMVGDEVCHSGATSHWQCGKVTYTDQTVDYGGGLVIEGLTYTTACSLAGDSGGGWLVGDKAAGLHDGGPSQCVSNPDKDNQSIFQPVNEALQKWNLKLVTG